MINIMKKNEIKWRKGTTILKNDERRPNGEVPIEYLSQDLKNVRK